MGALVVPLTGDDHDPQDEEHGCHRQPSHAEASVVWTEAQFTPQVRTFSYHAVHDLLISLSVACEIHKPTSMQINNN